jgi:hypothetical protein
MTAVLDVIGAQVLLPIAVNQSGNTANSSGWLRKRYVR